MVFAVGPGAPPRVHRCRSSSRAVLRYTGTSLEFGPAPGEAGGAALCLDGALSRVRSAHSDVFGSPALVRAGEAPVSAAICLSWAPLEGEALEETLPHAMRPDQN